MKNKKIKLIKTYLILGVFVVITFFLIVGVIKYFFIFSEAKLKHDSVAEKILTEEKKKNRLDIESKKKILGSEIEKNILDKYMLQKPGEKIIEIID